MIQGQFNCIITCKTVEEAFQIESFLNENNIVNWSPYYNCTSSGYKVYNLSFNEIELLEDFLVQKK